MLRIVAVAVAVLVSPFNAAVAGAAEDAPNCKDHPLFNRMSNFEIYQCSEIDFEAVEFAKPGLKQWKVPDDYESIEGKVYQVSYKLKEGATRQSALQVIRNFQNATRAAGGAVLGDFANPFAADLAESMQKFMRDSPGGTSFERYTNLKLTRGETEYWVNVAASGEYDDYNVVIVERKSMTQDVNVGELVAKLNKDGFITLYVNFDTNKSTIKADSAKTLDDAAAVLKAAPALAILVGGHTDNVGTPDANQKLSEDRARAVMAALVQRGIPAERLTAKGFGQTEPIADNRTEEGRAKNRRVELVKRDRSGT